MSNRSPESRRAFLQTIGVWSLGSSLVTAAVPAKKGSPEEDRILDEIRSNQPSRLTRLPAGFNAWLGSAHVAGKYCLSEQPFLIEGAERLIQMGSRLGKFWFMPDNPGGSYPYHSNWGKYDGFVALAQSEYFRKVFALPFETIMLEAHSPRESAWRRPGLPDDFYAQVKREFHDLTRHLYQTYRDRAVTFILQHWEGDWMLRGAGEQWNPPPSDWRERCERMTRWLAARQAGVSEARAAHGQGARCTVAHAAEVNRVADAWDNIPTMTRHVLPGVELDLISYSAYDGMSDPLRLYKCIQDIRQHAKTGPLYGPGAVYLGEIGIPENEQSQRIAERLDEWLGVALLTRMKWVAYWQLYCNEFSKDAKKPKTPISDPALVRGFWLVKPDGSLSQSGRYFSALWQRAK